MCFLHRAPADDALVPMNHWFGSARHFLCPKWSSLQAAPPHATPSPSLLSPRQRIPTAVAGRGVSPAYSEEDGEWYLRDSTCSFNFP